MTDLFLKIANMSIAAGWLVLAVLAARFIFKKAPKWVNVLLWGIVALRLISPFTVKSALSLIPSAETIPPDIALDTTPAIHTGISILNSTINPVINSTNMPAPGDSINPLQVTLAVAAAIWALGMALMACHALISYLRLRKMVRTAVPIGDNIFRSEHIPSPFVLGVIKPRIYLPAGLSQTDAEHVIAHEEAHIRRRDHWWKPLGYALLAVHWFNPLIWLGYWLLCRDIELACDEKVIKELGNDLRADYSQALLTCSVGRRMITACPLAFGEVGVKARVKSVLSYKKPAFWVIVAAVIACAVIAVCFLTDPRDKTEPAPLFPLTYAVSEVVYESPNYSFSVVANENSPWYHIGSGMVLMSCREYTEEGQWASLGPLTPFDLTKENFDDLFFKHDKGWHGEGSAAEMRRNNEKAWMLIYNDDRLYYVLQQKNGDVFLANGYNDFSEKDDPYSDDSSIRWLFRLSVTDTASGDLSGPIPGVYVQAACLYMHPLSSTIGMNGQRYLIGENYFTVLPGDGALDIDPETIITWPADADTAPEEDEEMTSWEWEPFPYTKEEWDALFVMDIWDGGSLIEDTQSVLYKRLVNGRFLAKVENELWVVETHSNQQMGTYIWSIYLIVPEGSGTIPWVYMPTVSSRPPVFQFQFDMEYTRITAETDGGRLVEFNYGDRLSASVLDIPSGQYMSWSPNPAADDLVLTVRDSVIRFTVYRGDEAVHTGTIYISSSGDNESGASYTGTLISDTLTLTLHPDYGSGVISEK